MIFHHYNGRAGFTVTVALACRSASRASAVRIVDLSGKPAPWLEGAPHVDTSLAVAAVRDWRLKGRKTKCATRAAYTAPHPDPEPDPDKCSSCGGWLDDCEGADGYGCGRARA